MVSTIFIFLITPMEREQDIYISKLIREKMRLQTEPLNMEPWVENELHANIPKFHLLVEYMTHIAEKEARIAAIDAVFEVVRLRKERKKRKKDWDTSFEASPKPQNVHPENVKK